MVRIKHRYYLEEIICDEALDKRTLQLQLEESQIFWAIHNAIELMYGDYGVGVTKSGLHVKMFNPYTRVFLLRMRRRFHTVVGASLPFVRKISDINCSLRTLHVGGTIRSCMKFLVRYDRQQLALLRKQYRQKVLQKAEEATRTCHRKIAGSKSDDEDQ